MLLSRVFAATSAGAFRRGFRSAAAPIAARGLATQAAEDAGSLVRLEAGAGAVATLRLCRPKKLNSLSHPMVHELSARYAELGGLGARCVFLRGEGRALCAGGDVVEVRESVLEANAVFLAEYIFDIYRLDYSIATLHEREKIVQVALWDGIVMGAGVGLSIHSPIRIATEKTLFAMPETAIGLYPDVGTTSALSRLSAGMPVGLMIGLTGQRVGAADCLFAGLATHYCPSGQLDAVKLGVESLGDAASDVGAVSDVISSVAQGAVPDTSKAVLENNVAAIEDCFGAGADTAEEILARLEADGGDFAAKVAATLKQRSPTSLKLALEGILRHRDASLREAFNTEYIMTQWCMRPAPHSDLCEGIRAVLVDRDNAPQWEPARLEDVPQERVNGFFAPLPADHPKGELGL